MHNHDHEKPNKYLVALILVLSVSGIIFAFSKPPKEEVVSGVVKEIIAEKNVTQEIDGQDIVEQELSVEIKINGEKKNILVLNDFYPVQTGDEVFISSSFFEEQKPNVIEISRNKGLFWLVLFFIALALVTGGWKGFYSLIGLVFSFAVIFNFIVPAILAGYNPVVIGLSGSVIILIPTLYLSYGWSKKSIAAFVGIILALLFVGVLANFLVSTLKFTGLTEEAIFLNIIGSDNAINLVGLLIAGIIIAAVGVIDDVAVTQASTVFNLVSVDSNLRGLALFKKAMVVGKDHISAVINTLVLAYTGAALPLILLLSLRGVSGSYFASMEIVSEEIIRTLVSSSGLLLAVPLTTLVAVLLLKGKINKQS